MQLCKEGGRRREENEWISSDPEISDLAEDVATPFYWHAPDILWFLHHREIETVKQQVSKRM
jgi:hypothetical protein